MRSDEKEVLPSIQAYGLRRKAEGENPVMKTAKSNWEIEPEARNWFCLTPYALGLAPFLIFGIFGPWKKVIPPAADRDKETVAVAILPNERGEELVGLAGETGLEETLADPAVRGMVGVNAQGRGIQRFPGFVIQNEMDGFQFPRRVHLRPQAPHHEGRILHLHRTQCP